MISEFIEALRTMDIDVDGVDADTRLGADLGMDSQEIVDLRRNLNSRFGVKIPERALRKTTTVKEALDLIESLKPVGAAAPTADRRGSCEAKAVLGARAADAYRALFELAGWTQHLPHVLAVDIKYDDGRYQEFTMTVQSKTGTINVRSIRRCDGGDSIEFFQPQPPAFLLEHSGGWRFTPLSPDTCEVVTYHRWKVNPATSQDIYGGSPEEQDEKIRVQLLEHAEFALHCWKKALESGALKRPRERDDEPAPTSLKPRGRHAVLTV
ncbi:phosphopantetheine-binding protein [Sorangium sp. So ce119]|uniref:phosphopantetheine-binding protein n=1 Tax=Sorangium sp. So ce119 TaxID=3133279 RepID=UPI003F639F11